MGIGSNDWHRSDGCRYHMDRNFYQGVAFTSIFYDAMQLLEDQFSHRDIDGKTFIWKKAEAILSEIQPEGFNHEQIKMRLQDGNFTFKQYFPFRERRLTFTGPKLPHDTEIGALAVAPWHGPGDNSMRTIRINFYSMINQFARNEYDIRRAVIETAAIVLHEIMHIEGFAHPDFPDVSSTDTTYMRSMPLVAQRAFTNLFYDNYLSLTGAQSVALVCCGLPIPRILNIREVIQSEEPVFESEILKKNNDLRNSES